MGMTEVIFELKPINSKIRGVALVTYCVKNMTITFLPMFRHLFDTIIVASSDKEQYYWSIKV